MQRIAPMLCKIGSKGDLKRKDYIFEPKLDGTRAICYFSKRRIDFVNRRFKNITYRYPEIVEELKKCLKAQQAVLDGEIIVYDEQGLPDFNLLQKREQIEKPWIIRLRSQQIPATYVVFDILEKNNKSLINLPLWERKKILEKIIKPNKRVEIIFYTINGQRLWKAVIKKNLEGVVAKPKNSFYFPNQRIAWLKIKYLKTVDCIIVGYTQEKRIISSLALALYRNNDLIYIGRVGTGFASDFLKNLYALIKKKKLEVKKTLVANPPKVKIHWLKPELVAEIEYLELTTGNELRAPSFKRLRIDKPPKDCLWESSFS